MHKDLKCCSLDQIKVLASDYSQQHFMADYLFGFIHQKFVTSIDEITPLSKSFRTKLKEDGFYIAKPNLLQTQEDSDASIKFLFDLGEDQRIESVLIRDGQRQTLCISSQTGCAMGCAFCATAKLKAPRNLSVGEIVSQVYEVQREHGRIANVVYMGMGEPLNNYENVLQSVRILNHTKGIDLGIRQITISTCGVVPGIRRLAAERLGLRLAISLNAPSDEIRNRIMPVNKTYPIPELLQTVRDYQKLTNRRVTFEYVLLKDINSRIEHARQLVKLLSDIKCNINLIAYNPNEHCSFEAPTKTQLNRFAQYLQSHNIESVIRASKGSKVKAACGQLGANIQQK